MHPIWNVPVPCSGKPSQNVFFDDFMDASVSATADLARYMKLADNGTIALSDTFANGVITITGNATAATATVTTQNGAPWEVHPEKAIYFEARVLLEDADVSDWEIGLMTENTANPHDTAPTNGIYFGASGDANLDYVIEPGPGGTASRVDTGTDLSDGSWVTIAFKLTSTKCYLWVDEEGGSGPSLVGTVTSGLPPVGTELQLNIANEGGAKYLAIDYILITQDRIAD